MGQTPLWRGCVGGETCSGSWPVRVAGVNGRRGKEQRRDGSVSGLEVGLSSISPYRPKEKTYRINNHVLKYV